MVKNDKLHHESTMTNKLSVLVNCDSSWLQMLDNGCFIMVNSQCVEKTTSEKTVWLQIYNRSITKQNSEYVATTCNRGFEIYEKKSKHWHLSKNGTFARPVMDSSRPFFAAEISSSHWQCLCHRSTCRLFHSALTHQRQQHERNQQLMKYNTKLQQQ